MIDPDRKARLLARLAPQPAPLKPLPDLAKALADLAARGRLKHLLINRTPKGYQASYMNEDGTCRVSVRDDALHAILIAIGAVTSLEISARERARS